MLQLWSCSMVYEPLPRSLKKATERLESEPGHAWRLVDLASLSGVSPRTLQKHFRRFLGCSPRAFLEDLRFQQVRRDLLAACDNASVTDVATRVGFTHLARFASGYRRRYGENPSTTLRRSQRLSLSLPTMPVFVSVLDRPAVAILPFDRFDLPSSAATPFAEDIAVAVWRLRWIKVAEPAGARYHLRGSVHKSAGQTRITVRLVDSPTGRCVWAAHWDGDQHDPIAFEERLATAVARAIEPALRAAEVARASRGDRADLSGWELTMRALPCVTSVEPEAQSVALELLNEAIERAPYDPLPMSMAAWCHGLRAGHHFTPRPEVERTAARELAARAARLNTGDALAETMLAAAYTLVQDLQAAAAHTKRALALDGGSAWAWGRNAWLKAYGGYGQEAIEEFLIARSLAPSDPLSFLWSVGIASAEFQRGRYDESIRWFNLALEENPASAWINRFLAPAYVLGSQMDAGRLALLKFASAFPGVTIADIRSSLPWNDSYMDRVSEGLEHLGMPR
jgi:AraC-like DNA-binding protein/tetratricopeptide (TPR) repeat protein